VSNLDIAATAFLRITSPVLRLIARRRDTLPMFAAAADRAGVSLRTTHYYEPSYRESDLPAHTAGVRSLPAIDLNEQEQLQFLRECRFADELSAIPVVKSGETSFGYDNGMYEYGDAEMLYNMIRVRKPARIIEIGSGQSTLMARLAIGANKAEHPDYACEHICIEPYEMAWLEQTGVTVIRERVENVALSIFDSLSENDILFIDSSHVIRPWGDVLREFNEIVPRVASGVLIHVHDIFTPRDYPEAWLRSQRRLWNEQYLLESFLAYNSRYKILCALNWLKHEHFDAIAAACPMLTVKPGAEPGAFWFTKV
jgi:predicted O-methyltransferase YrrM